MPIRSWDMYAAITRKKFHKETLEEFLARGGKIKRVDSPAVIERRRMIKITPEQFEQLKARVSEEVLKRAMRKKK